MAKQTSRLGKGLSSLVRKTTDKPAVAAATAPVPPPVSSVPVDDPQVPAGPPRAIPIELIQVNRQQPRELFAEQPLAELTASVKRHGIMQPLVVRKLNDDGKYELIAGERRLRAARQAGLTEVPITLRECDDRESLELALIENLQREDLNPLERARAYRRYLDETGATTDELAEQLGQSRPNIANHLRLLNLSPDVQDLVAAGELAMGHARALLAVDSSEKQLALARQVIRKQMSTRQIESLVAGRTDRLQPSVMSGTPSRHMQSLEDAMSRVLGVKVSIVTGRRKNSGRIVLQYKDLTEFDRIAERLGLAELAE